MQINKLPTVLEVLEELADTSGKNDKIAILERERDNKPLVKVIRYALDPFLTFGIKKIPEHTKNKKKNSSYNFDGVYKLLDQLVERKLTGNNAITKLTTYLSELTEDDSLVLERIIQKDLKCGVAASTVNKVWDKLVPVYPCMLCNSYNEKNMKAITYPAIAQEKLDGMRVNVICTGGKVEFRSRNGKVINLLGYLESEFDHLVQMGRAVQKVVFDGELLVVDNDGNILPRKTGNGICNKAIKGKISDEEASRIVVKLWDAIPYNAFKRGEYKEGYAERLMWLNQRVSHYNGFDGKIGVAETEIVENLDEAREFFFKVTERGDEGIILKNSNSFWKDGRSKDQVKMKIENTADLVITDVFAGTGKYEGKLGSFLVESADGLLEVSIGSGFSDEQREEYFTRDMIGKIVEVKYNEIITNEKDDMKSLFLPIFMEIREDKDTANKLSELK